MASPPSSREDPPSLLPAPYEEPWRRLATDLAAVVATARLKARELWRLNGEGTLATPAFWPRGLTPLFWPLLLALGLVLVAGLATRLPGGWGGPPEDPAAERTAAVAPQAPGRGTGSLPLGIPGASQAPDAFQADQLQDDVVAAPPPSTLALPEDTRSAGGPSAAPRPVDQSGGPTGLRSPWPWSRGRSGQSDRAAGGPELQEAGAAPATAPTAGAPSGTVRGDSSPLGSGDGPSAGSAADGAAVPASSPLAELVGADPPAWVLALEQRPAEGLLRLRLASGYGALPLAERRTLAERWLDRARELGYERLELEDPAGRLLARPARVGSGMILLDALDPFLHDPASGSSAGALGGAPR